MKKSALFAALGLVLALTACAAEPAGPASSTPAPESAPAVSPTPAPESASPSPAAEAGGLMRVNGGSREAFAAALERLLQEHILPDGTDAGLLEGYDMADNRFAVCDVDGDGERELILIYESTMVAGRRGYVFSWNGETGEVGVQLETSPELTFYESGAVQSDSQHNQQLISRDFWPYALYRYDKYLDVYVEVGSVHAWGREALENGYPEEADKSGTGFVYYIAADGGDSDEPLDASVYQAWRYVYVRDSQEIQPEYLALTEENVQSILAG